MASIEKLHWCGAELLTLLGLRTSPIALRFLRSEAEVPAQALRPKRDRGYHLAQCQAFALTRNQKVTVAMLKEDHWCWAPLDAYGLVPPLREPPAGALGMVESPEAARRLWSNGPRLEYGQYAGTVIAPLETTTFEPDLAIIYMNSAQLRSCLLAIKYTEGTLVNSEFDPIDSCVFCTIPTLLTGEYRITMPDPGDYERAMASEDEIILTVHATRLDSLVSGLRRFRQRGVTSRPRATVITPDFPQPPFYRDLFRQWGLDAPE
jgi:uncharacterized protein (DUF169 family)